MSNRYRVKEFARLTRVTVRALHYYDRIGLLEPSGRMPNRYRHYTERPARRGGTAAAPARLDFDSNPDIGFF